MSPEEILVDSTYYNGIGTRRTVVSIDNMMPGSKRGILWVVYYTGCDENSLRRITINAFAKWAKEKVNAKVSSRTHGSCIRESDA
jgi:hypothetical protein